MQTHGATYSADSSLAIFAHELREPLASIRLAAQAAGETANNDQTNREMWGIVERQSHYLARLIERVMKLSRGSHEKVALFKEWFDLGTTIVNAVEAVKPLLVNRGHRLTVSLPPDPVFVLADAVRVQQIVVNLLANAAKYTAPGGRIALGLEVANGLVVIEVRDNGAGIPRELLPHVFDLFRQGESPRGGGSSGLGIGLALVKSLVEWHGGSVRAHSAGAGTGSTFVVVLPAAGSGSRDKHADGSGEAGAQPGWTGNAMLDA